MKKKKRKKNKVSHDFFESFALEQKQLKLAKAFQDKFYRLHKTYKIFLLHSNLPTII